MCYCCKWILGDTPEHLAKSTLHLKKKQKLEITLDRTVLILKEILEVHKLRTLSMSVLLPCPCCIAHT